jgi:hypothetical protein
MNSIVFMKPYNIQHLKSQSILFLWYQLKIIMNIFNCWLGFMVLNATFNNISAISWRPVLVVEEAGVPGENHRPWASNW